jgi:hypothetical protein
MEEKEARHRRFLSRFSVLPLPHSSFGGPAGNRVEDRRADHSDPVSPLALSW